MANLFGAASTSGVLVDRALVFIIGTSFALLAVVTFTMLLFVVRYDRRRHPRAENAGREAGPLTEIAWASSATALVLLMFWFGWRDFGYLRTPPADALPVQVTAREWSWSFTYANGKHSDVLKVPLNRPTRLTMTSLDVIHAAYIPAFRIKEDVVPGMTTHLWFTPTAPGAYDLFCTEYCGVGHSHMRATVEVLPGEAFDRWLAEAAPATREPATGVALLAEKGCLDCHAVAGRHGDAPAFRGLFGTEVTVKTRGVERRVRADAAYLRRSILEPQADLVTGYAEQMPTIPVTEAELDALVAAIVALGGEKQ
jgi:cytochrome c oxidase subunit 2